MAGVFALVVLLTGCASGSPAPAAALVGTSWTVTSIAKEDTTATPPTMVFGADSSISGTTGCNQYTGSYETDGAKITIGSIASTAMACVDPDVSAQAADFLAALGGAVSWEIQPDGKLEIRAPSAITDLKGTADIVAVPAGATD